MAQGRLAGQVALVTGGARGTGEAIVRRFAAEGAKVACLDVLEERGEKLAASLGDDVRFWRADVTSEADWDRVVAEVLAAWDRLDVLVNNAAVLHLATLDRTSAEDFERILRVNSLGPFLGIRACLAALRAGGGSIVNVGSVDSISGTPTTAAYTSSKFALRGLTKVVALEEGKHGIRCNIVCPGGGNPEMVTDFFARQAGGSPGGADAGGTAATGGGERLDHSALSVPLGRPAELDELAAAVLYFASDDSSYCSGTELVVDGGRHAGMYLDVPGLFTTR